MKISITPGTIHVNSIIAMYDTPDMKIFHLDCRDKHVQCFCVGYNNDSVSLHLGKNSWQMIEVKEDDDTKVVFDFELEGSDDWSAIVDSSKYMVRVCFYKTHSEYQQVWSDEDGS